VAEKQLKFFGAQKKEETKKTKATTSSSSVGKKDIFLMSFFAFLAAGFVFGTLFLIVGTITGNSVIDLSGEKGVMIEETEDTVVAEETTEEPETTPEVTEEETVEEEEPAPVVESDCGKDISLDKDDTFSYEGKTIIPKLVAGHSAQISVGGKSVLLSVGSTEEINGLKIKLLDTDGDEIKFRISC
jgi:hypothetical protein